MTIMPTPQSPREVFPLREADVIDVLAEIKADPHRTLSVLESDYLAASNPHLSFLCVVGAKTIGDRHVGAYIDGVLASHKLLRQASMPDGLFPLLGPASVPFLADIMTRELHLDGMRYADKPKEEKGHIADSMIGAFGCLLASEKGLISAINDLSGYRTDIDGYKAGAAMVVAAARVATEGPFEF